MSYNDARVYKHLLVPASPSVEVFHSRSVFMVGSNLGDEELKHSIWKSVLLGLLTVREQFFSWIVTKKTICLLENCWCTEISLYTYWHTGIFIIMSFCFEQLYLLSFHSENIFGKLLIFSAYFLFYLSMVLINPFLKLPPTILLIMGGTS